jgi:excisionase family DNA binding protein
MEKIITTHWKTTKEIAENLGISKDKVLKWIRSGAFQPGVHYRNISFDGKRPTYRFDLTKINQLFEE